MAFNKLGYFTLAPGKSMHIWYWFGGPPGLQAGEDRGAQHAMADPEANPGILWVTQQGKEKVQAPTPHGATGFVFVRYHVIVDYQPTDPRRTIDFTIQGGGFV
jgi:hypothetical protein